MSSLATLSLSCLRLRPLLSLRLRLRLENQLPLLIARNARPPGLEALLTRVEARERMRFRVQHNLVERQDIGGAEEEVEILEGFGLDVLVRCAACWR